MSPLTLAELAARHSELNLKAERLRAEWMAAPVTGPRALSLGRQVKAVAAQAADYAAILRVAEGMS